MKKINISEKKFKTDRAGQDLSFSSGKLCPQADGSVIITLGETSLLTVAVMEKNPNIENDFLPLTVDFRETFYAGGKIGGGQYNKREGRPSDNAILISRLTDRPLRPLFPEGMVNDVVLNVHSLSMDKNNKPGVLSIISSSLALMIAGIPFGGPVGAVRIGYMNSEFIINPSYEQIKKGELNLVLAGPKNKINMIECGSKEIDENILIKALELGQQEINKVCQRQEEFISQFEVTKKEIKINKPTEKTLSFIEQILTQEKVDKLYPSTKTQVNLFFETITKQVLENAKEHIEDESNDDFTNSKINSGIFKVFKKRLRYNLLNKGLRIDGRQLDEIRPLYCEIGLIPRVHGSGLFQRGETQCLSITTLGAPSDALVVDTMEDDDVELRFIHHYNMPPYSNNEAKPTRFVSRRELGHGKLAEKSLISMIPNEDEFPYVIRTVSEILSSNGSTSMASTCACTLSLLDAGVPLKEAVSGIAMGLITDENNNYKILTDIQGLEDFTGDMDFKITGTNIGINALQLDMKLDGLGVDIIVNGIKEGNIGRLKILNFMMETISKPNKINKYAPLISTIKVDPSLVREVIGPGGATINDIIKRTNVKIDFKEDGTCLVTANNQIDGEEAIKIIKDIIWQPKEGDIVEGAITRVEQYGVFVSIGKNKSGLCHVKNLGPTYIENPASMFKIGDKIKVKVIGIDKDGKIQLKKEF